MREAIPPLPNTSSWHNGHHFIGWYLVKHKDKVLYFIYIEFSARCYILLEGVLYMTRSCTKLNWKLGYVVSSYDSNLDAALGHIRAVYEIITGTAPVRDISCKRLQTSSTDGNVFYLFNLGTNIKSSCRLKL
jgi:hypothetical protein